jgi:hypothetical protein
MDMEDCVCCGGIITASALNVGGRRNAIPAATSAEIIVTENISLLRSRRMLSQLASDISSFESESSETAEKATSIL